MSTLDKIILLLRTKHLSQKDLTDYLGLSKNTFTSWKSSRNTSYIKHIDKIADFLNVSTDYLLGKTEIKMPSEPGKNGIKIVGRDGSYFERTLTDSQIDLLKQMIAQMPDADDYL